MENSRGCKLADQNAVRSSRPGSSTQCSDGTVRRTEQSTHLAGSIQYTQITVAGVVDTDKGHGQRGTCNHSILCKQTGGSANVDRTCCGRIIVLKHILRVAWRSV